MNKKPTPDALLAAIHKHCLDCSGGSRKETHRCRMKGCALWPYREPESTAAADALPKGAKQQTIFDIVGGDAACAQRKREQAGN